VSVALGANTATLRWWVGGVGGNCFETLHTSFHTLVTMAWDGDGLGPVPLIHWIPWPITHTTQA